MDIDFFVLIEKFFQGTVLFVLKFFLTVGRLIIRPVSESISTYEKFKADKTVEIGPVTFIFSCVFLFYFVLSLVILRENSKDVSTFFEYIERLDTGSARIPFFLIVASTVTFVVIIDLFYRLSFWLSEKAGIVTTETEAKDLWRAVGLYATGLSAVIFLVVVGFSSAIFILRGGDKGLLSLFLILLSSFVISAYVPTRFLTRLDIRGEAKSFLARTLFFSFLYLYNIGAFALSVLVVVNARPFLEGGGAFIADISCNRQMGNTGPVEVLVEIKNNGSRAELVRTNAWTLRISESLSQQLFTAESKESRFEDRVNPPNLIVKPSSTIYGVISFPTGSTSVPVGWVTCSLFTPGMRLKKEKVTTFDFF